MSDSQPPKRPPPRRRSALRMKLQRTTTFRVKRKKQSEGTNLRTEAVNFMSKILNVPNLDPDRVRWCDTVLLMNLLNCIYPTSQIKVVETTLDQLIISENTNTFQNTLVRDFSYDRRMLFNIIGVMENRDNDKTNLAKSILFLKDIISIFGSKRCKTEEIRTIHIFEGDIECVLGINENEEITENCYKNKFYFEEQGKYRIENEEQMEKRDRKWLNKLIDQTEKNDPNLELPLFLKGFEYELYDYIEKKDEEQKEKRQRQLQTKLRLEQEEKLLREKEEAKYLEKKKIRELKKEKKMKEFNKELAQIDDLDIIKQKEVELLKKEEELKNRENEKKKLFKEKIIQQKLKNLKEKEKLLMKREELVKQTEELQNQKLKVLELQNQQEIQKNEIQLDKQQKLIKIQSQQEQKKYEKLQLKKIKSLDNYSNIESGSNNGSKNKSDTKTENNIKSNLLALNKSKSFSTIEIEKIGISNNHSNNGNNSKSESGSSGIDHKNENEKSRNKLDELKHSDKIRKEEFNKKKIERRKRSKLNQNIQKLSKDEDEKLTSESDIKLKQNQTDLLEHERELSQVQNIEILNNSNKKILLSSDTLNKDSSEISNWKDNTDGKLNKIIDENNGDSFGDDDNIKEGSDSFVDMIGFDSFDSGSDSDTCSSSKSKSESELSSEFKSKPEFEEKDKYENKIKTEVEPIQDKMENRKITDLKKQRSSGVSNSSNSLGVDVLDQESDSESGNEYENEYENENENENEIKSTNTNKVIGKMENQQKMEKVKSVSDSDGFDDSTSNSDFGYEINSKKIKEDTKEENNFNLINDLNFSYMKQSSVSGSDKSLDSSTTLNEENSKNEKLGGNEKVKNGGNGIKGGYGNQNSDSEFNSEATLDSDFGSESGSGSDLKPKFSEESENENENYGIVQSIDKKRNDEQVETISNESVNTLNEEKDYTNENSDENANKENKMKIQGTTKEEEVEKKEFKSKSEDETINIKKQQGGSLFLNETNSVIQKKSNSQSGSEFKSNSGSEFNSNSDTQANSQNEQEPNSGNQNKEMQLGSSFETSSSEEGLSNENENPKLINGFEEGDQFDSSSFSSSNESDNENVKQDKNENVQSIDKENVNGTQNGNGNGNGYGNKNENENEKEKEKENENENGNENDNNEMFQDPKMISEKTKTIPSKYSDKTQEIIEDSDEIESWGRDQNNYQKSPKNNQTEIQKNQYFEETPKSSSDEFFEYNGSKKPGLTKTTYITIIKKKTRIKIKKKANVKSKSKLKPIKKRTNKKKSSSNSFQDQNNIGLPNHKNVEDENFLEQASESTSEGNSSEKNDKYPSLSPNNLLPDSGNLVKLTTKHNKKKKKESKKKSKKKDNKGNKNKKGEKGKKKKKKDQKKNENKEIRWWSENENENEIENEIENNFNQKENKIIKKKTMFAYKQLKKNGIEIIDVRHRKYLKKSTLQSLWIKYKSKQKKFSIFEKCMLLNTFDQWKNIQLNKNNPIEKLLLTEKPYFQFAMVDAIKDTILGGTDFPVNVKKRNEKKYQRGSIILNKNKITIQTKKEILLEKNWKNFLKIGILTCDTIYFCILDSETKTFLQVKGRSLHRNRVLIFLFLIFQLSKGRDPRIGNNFKVKKIDSNYLGTNVLPPLIVPDKRIQKHVTSYKKWRRGIKNKEKTFKEIAFHYFNQKKVNFRIYYLVNRQLPYRSCVLRLTCKGILFLNNDNKSKNSQIIPFLDSFTINKSPKDSKIFLIKNKPTRIKTNPTSLSFSLASTDYLKYKSMAKKRNKSRDRSINRKNKQYFILAATSAEERELIYQCISLFYKQYNRK
ncbi:ran binding protein [Anaeramoeba flamelloides]|uniref:Ran binding protein n=1 Tax=Anaeramoeba flamelloides TaxID=1746091 RepID=A0AAV7Z4X4_9EUKA|nr:ran binding protein [Anaeramoeba flamelloides]